MTEDEAISILEEELVSPSGWLAQARRGETKDGAPPVRIYEALSALSEAWAHTMFVPKRAILPILQIDAALCSINSSEDQLPDDFSIALANLLLQMEGILAGDNSSSLHLVRYVTKKANHITDWPLSAGLHDEALSQVLDFLTGDDGVMFGEITVLPLTEANTQYARTIFQTLIERHGNSERTPRILAAWLISLRDHLVAWQSNSETPARRAELADELLELVFQYLSGADKRSDSGYEQLKWAWPEDSNQVHC